MTLTTVFETVEKKIKSFFANGTNNAPGGPAVVNDQNGANFQELVIPKGGNPLLFSGRNVFLPNLKKGSTVVPANKTKRILSSIPHFKNGTANNTRALGTLLKASAINQDTNVVINNNSQAADLKNVEVKLDKMIMLLSGKLTVDVDSDNRLIVKNDNIRTTMQEIGWQTQINQRGRLNG